MIKSNNKEKIISKVRPVKWIQNITLYWTNIDSFILITKDF